MSKLTKQFKGIHNIAVLRAVISEGGYEWIAAIPLILTGSLPFLFVCRNSLFHPARTPLDTLKYLYPDLFSAIFPFCIVCAIITAGVCLGKINTKKIPFKTVLLENKTLFIFSIFILWMLISTFINDIIPWLKWGDSHKIGYSIPKMFSGYPYEPENLAEYISYFAVWFFCASCIANPKIKALILRYLSIMSFLLGFFSLIDYYFIPLEPFRHFWVGEVAGSYTNPNYYGYHLTLGILMGAGMYVWEQKSLWKYIGFLSFAIQTCVLIVNNTFGSWVACALGLIFLVIMDFIITRRLNLRGLALIGCFLLLSAVIEPWNNTVFTQVKGLFSDVSVISQKGSDVAVSGSAGNGRWELWVFTTKKILERPLFGYGVEGLAAQMLQELWRTRPHNEYLQYTYFFGIPAGILYVSGIFSVFLRGLKNKLKLNGIMKICLVAAFGYAVSAFFGNTQVYIVPYFFTLLGLGYRVPSECLGE